jgi:hypothetical protein
VEEELVFRPPLRQGLILHSIIGILLVASSGLLLWRAFQGNIGLAFLFYLVLSLVVAVLIPVLIYRAYSLYKASYTLERDGIRLVWGLRTEVIPMDEVLWAVPAENFSQSFQLSLAGTAPGDLQEGAAPVVQLPLPRLSWPGSVLGISHLPDKTPVEYLAANSSQMILIGTPGKVFAITPADRAAFLQGYQRFAELGSLSPLPAQSVFPTFLLARVWNERPARYLLLFGLVLSLALLVWVSLVAPGKAQISLGFEPTGALREPVPAVQLLLVPIISLTFFLIDFLLGLFFFRWSGDRREAPEAAQKGESLQGERSPAFWQVMAYLLWGSGAITPLVFMLALVFILRAQ